MPLFPFVTLIGAIGLALIEIKSIYEKAEDKVRIDNTVTLAGKVIADKGDIENIVKDVVDYMNQPEKHVQNDNGQSA